MLKANTRQGKAGEEALSSNWTSVRKATKAKVFATAGKITQHTPASNPGGKPFTKQKSRSFEEKMDHGGSGPVSEVVFQLWQNSPKMSFFSFPGFLRRRDGAVALTLIRCQAQDLPR